MALTFPRSNIFCAVPKQFLTIADYFGASLVSIGELIGCDLSSYPNIKRWLDNMKTLKSWSRINEVFDGFVTANKSKEFVRL